MDMLTVAMLSASALMTVGAGEAVRSYCRRALRTPSVASAPAHTPQS